MIPTVGWQACNYSKVKRIRRENGRRLQNDSCEIRLKFGNLLETFCSLQASVFLIEKYNIWNGFFTYCI